MVRKNTLYKILIGSVGSVVGAIVGLLLNNVTSPAINITIDNIISEYFVEFHEITNLFLISFTLMGVIGIAMVARPLIFDGLYSKYRDIRLRVRMLEVATRIILAFMYIAVAFAAMSYSDKPWLSLF